MANQMRDEKKIVRFPDAHAVEMEAAQWCVRLEKDGVNADVCAEFQEWKDRSPKHREAAARLSAVWSEFDALKNFVEPLKDNSIQQIVDGGRRPRWRLAFAAAACLCVMVAGAYFYRSNPPPPSVVTVRYETPVGGQRVVKLDDGSTVALNTDSKIEAFFYKDRREVRLIKGEAYFDVVHDAARPFLVLTRGNVFRDIGTAFDIRQLPTGSEITVLHGSVALSSRSAKSGETVRLGVASAGQYALVSRKIERLETVSEADIWRLLAWRHGALVYAGDPLVKVVNDVNRYSKVKILIEDPELAVIPVGGYFEIGKLDTFLVALEKNFGIRALPVDALHIRLVSDLRARGRAADFPVSERTPR